MTSSVRVNRENRVAKSLFDSTWAHHSHFVCSASLSPPPSLCASLNLLLLLLLPLAACIKHLPSFSFIWIEKLFAAICYASLENKQEKNNQKKCKKKTRGSRRKTITKPDAQNLLNAFPASHRSNYTLHLAFRARDARLEGRRRFFFFFASISVCYQLCCCCEM